MPDPRPLTGLFGKVPAHGDFVRRGLPSSFVTPWDEWLQGAVAAARGQLGTRWDSAWDSAPAWRFALPPGACGPDAVAGVMLPSQDQVGRRFPITLAALLPADARLPGADWFDAVEAAALAGRDGRADADALAAAIPLPGGPVVAPAFGLPAVAAAPAMAIQTDSSWATANAPQPDDGPPAMMAEVDVLAMLGAGAAEGAMPASPAGDDALALLLGGSGSAPSPEAMPQDGTLSALIGAAPDEPPALPGPAASGDPGVADADSALAALIGDAPLGPSGPGHPDDPGAADAALAALIGDAPLEPLGSSGSGRLDDSDTADADGTLAALIGGAASAPPNAPAVPLPGGATDGDDVLAGLIGAAATEPPELRGAMDAAPLRLSAAAELPGDIDFADLLPETVAAAWPDLQPPVHGTLPAEAPPAPDGGGWWTRGGAHVPPMVWPLAALPASSDFAYLLESAA